MSIPDFVELSPDPWPTSKKRSGKNDKESDLKIFAACTRCKNSISSFPPIRAEESWKIDFTADGSGGKAAIASFPPLRAEENWKIHFTADGSGGKAAVASFPPLVSEESWKIHFTADESGGKAATAGFPPLIVEENWKMGVYRPCMQRQSGVTVRLKSQELSIPN